MLYTLKVRSHEREELVEFTDQVQKELASANQQEGVVLLYSTYHRRFDGE